MTSVLRRDGWGVGAGGTGRAGGEGHAERAEAGGRARQAQTKHVRDCLPPPGARREAQSRLPLGLQGTPTRDTLTSDLRPPQLSENTVRLFLATSFVAACHGSPGKLTQTPNPVATALGSPRRAWKQGLTGSPAVWLCPGHLPSLGRIATWQSEPFGRRRPSAPGRLHRALKDDHEPGEQGYVGVFEFIPTCCLFF